MCVCVCVCVRERERGGGGVGSSRERHPYRLSRRGVGGGSMYILTVNTYAVHSS